MAYMAGSEADSAMSGRSGNCPQNATHLPDIAYQTVELFMDQVSSAHQPLDVEVY